MQTVGDVIKLSVYRKADRIERQKAQHDAPIQFTQAQESLRRLWFQNTDSLPDAWRHRLIKSAVAIRDPGTIASTWSCPAPAPCASIESRSGGPGTRDMYPETRRQSLA